MASARAGAAAAKKQLGTVRIFLHSESGQNVMNGVGIIGAAAAGGCYILAHSYLAYKYQDVVQQYKHGFPSKVSPEMINRGQEVARDLGLKERFVAAVNIFHAYGFEPLVIGSLKTTDGVRLGLPKYLEYKQSSDVERYDIQIEQQPVKWHTEEGMSFANSLLLSESAKRFVIAQQLSMADSFFVYIHAGLIAGSIAAYKTLTFYLNRKTYGFLRPTSYRAFLYTCCGTFCYGAWSALTDVYNKRLERKGDERAAGISLDYARGGVEYYSKMLQRNMALRELMGPRGEKLFSPLGNYEQFLRQRYIPLTARKEFLEKIVQQNVEPSPDSNNNDEKDL